MPKTKTTQPIPDREKGQRSLDPIYFQRLIPEFGRSPYWFDGDLWRRIVESQPVAIACRETLISNLVTLDWKIEPKKSEQRDEYRDEIDYYTDFFTHTGEYDYTEIIEWIIKDLLDVPFGAAAELGYEHDDPDNRLLWIELLDGATLWPTLNSDWPVGQTLKENMIKTVYFPYYAINRIYLSPRTEIKMKGWGLTPPQKIYLALEALNRGDHYYLQLLIDTPEAGILDLGDMSKSSAEEWVQAWRTMLNGIDPFKIPVLYEHDKAVEWIPFTRSPTEIMYDTAIMRYSSILAAGYGLTLSDIGFQSVSSGGDTLAGTIRNERTSRRSGLGRVKAKVKSFFNRMLPSYLKYVFIDLDDETSVAMGRARLATITALGLAIDKRMLLPEEGRQQLLADGLLNISIPETLPEGAFDDVSEGEVTNERTNMLGKPVAPSQGGYGEVRSEVIDYALNNDATFRSLYYNLQDNFELLSEDAKQFMVKGLQDYLRNYQNKVDLLDECGVLDNNSDVEEILDEQKTERQAEEIVTIG